MKQEICCLDCSLSWAKTSRKPQVKAAGEKVTITEGSALKDYHCDGCNAELSSGSTVYAVGVIAPGQNPHTGWESRFIGTELDKAKRDRDLIEWLKNEGNES